MSTHTDVRGSTSGLSWGFSTRAGPARLKKMIRNLANDEKEEAGYTHPPLEMPRMPEVHVQL